MKILLKGLAIILPLAVIGLTCFWLIYTLEFWLAKTFRVLFSEKVYYPGMGLLLGIVISFLVGLVMSAPGAPKLYRVFEHLLQRIPLVKSLYGAVQDIVGTFSTDRKKRYNRVVIVRFKGANVRLVGFVTQEDLNHLPLGVPDNDSVAVYLPMSYQIGGYMIFVPRSMVEPINLSIEDASRLVLTAGMSGTKSDTPS